MDSLHDASGLDALLHGPLDRHAGLLQLSSKHSRLFRTTTLWPWRGPACGFQCYSSTPSSSGQTGPPRAHLAVPSCFQPSPGFTNRDVGLRVGISPLCTSSSDQSPDRQTVSSCFLVSSRPHRSSNTTLRPTLQCLPIRLRMSATSLANLKAATSEWWPVAGPTWPAISWDHVWCGLTTAPSRHRSRRAPSW